MRQPNHADARCGHWSCPHRRDDLLLVATCQGMLQNKANPLSLRFCYTSRKQERSRSEASRFKGIFYDYLLQCGMFQNFWKKAVLCTGSLRSDASDQK